MAPFFFKTVHLPGMLANRPIIWIWFLLSLKKCPIARKEWAILVDRTKYELKLNRANCLRTGKKQCFYDAKFAKKNLDPLKKA